MYTQPWQSVHPHTRGDIVGRRATNKPSSGSPPHAWGHWLRGQERFKRLRFTPTRVGTFPTRPASSATGPVHPHTRGDIWAPPSGYLFLVGSPPHAWGHFHYVELEQSCIRFTPTRVGTLSRASFTVAFSPVHPHTRGDIDAPGREALKRSGSPPHAWGHSGEPFPQSRPRRFTPTRVGTFRPWPRI